MGYPAEIRQIIGNDAKLDTSGLGIGLHSEFRSSVKQPFDLMLRHAPRAKSAFGNSHGSEREHPASGGAFLGIRSSAFLKEDAEIHALSMGGNREQKTGKNNNKAHGCNDTPTLGEIQ